MILMIWDYIYRFDTQHKPFAYATNKVNALAFLFLCFVAPSTTPTLSHGLFAYVRYSLSFHSSFLSTLLVDGILLAATCGILAATFQYFQFYITHTHSKIEN